MHCHGVSNPTKNEYKACQNRGYESSMWVDVARHLDPALVYWALTKDSQKPALLLESQQRADSINRYSIVLSDPQFQFISKDKKSIWVHANGEREHLNGNPLLLLRENIKTRIIATTKSSFPFCGGAAGLFAYELKNHIEKFRGSVDNPYGLPDIHLGFFDKGVIVDHLKNTSHVFCLSNSNSTYEESCGIASLWAEEVLQRTESARLPNCDNEDFEFDVDTSSNKEPFIKNVLKAKQYIREGDVYQVNLSHALSVPAPPIPFVLYLKQRQMNPTAFASFADFGEYQLISSSPERLIKLKNGIVETRPIAGTRPCSKDPKEDNKLSCELFLSEKEKAEHVMLVDLERNDIGKVCRHGSVHVNEFMICEEYSHVRHIVSNVMGQLAEGKDVVDLLASVFPGGTITGAPKIRAMEIIDQLEGKVRGAYTGSLGYIGYDGNCDLNIIIRTLLVQNSKAYLQVGAGIVADSEPSKEYDETIHKAQAFLDIFKRPAQKIHIN